MRERMESEIGKEATRGKNPKVGRGGIVDIEFAVQYLQLAHGHDHPSIRSTSTPAGAAPAARGRAAAPTPTTRPWPQGYEFHRRLATRMRIVHDYGIDYLPAGGHALAQLARRLGYHGEDPGGAAPRRVHPDDRRGARGLRRRHVVVVWKRLAPEAPCHGHPIRPEAPLRAPTSRLPPRGPLSFGQLRTDHMFLMDYEDGRWIDPRIVPYGPLSLAPGAVVLHYAQEIFEGAKAFLHDDGEVHAFRIDKNAARLNRSGAGVLIPPIPEDDQVQAILSLLDVDRLWAPHQEGASLYIRPFVFGTQDSLGVKPSTRYTFCVFLSPSGPYYPAGFREPVKLLVTRRFHRAAPGGTGAFKTGGNYAASLMAGHVAHEHGASQVLFLDVTDRYIEEAGAMNHFHVTRRGALVIPTFTETILRSITSESVLELGERELGVETGQDAHPRRGVPRRRALRRHHRGGRLRHRGGGLGGGQLRLRRRHGAPGRRRPHRRPHPPRLRGSLRHPARQARRAGGLALPRPAARVHGEAKGLARLKPRWSEPSPDSKAPAGVQAEAPAEAEGRLPLAPLAHLASPERRARPGIPRGAVRSPLRRRNQRLDPSKALWPDSFPVYQYLSGVHPRCEPVTSTSTTAPRT